MSFRPSRRQLLIGGMVGVGATVVADAGHTHGGQVRVIGEPLVVPPGSGPFASGWYDTNLGRLYVSRGLGTSVVPARFGCRPELAVFRLRPRA